MTAPCDYKGCDEPATVQIGPSCAVPFPMRACQRHTPDLDALFKPVVP